MRYERRSSFDAPRRPPSWRRRGLALLAIGAVVGGTIGAVVASRPPGRRPAAPDRAAIETAFLRANVFLENLGAPPPAGVSSPSWALRSVPLAAGSGTPRLAVEEHPWVDGSGHLVLLSEAEASRLLSDQRRLARGLFTGALGTTVEQQLTSIVRDETRLPGKPSGPGGARVTSWLGVSQDGDHARAEAIVENWIQVDRVEHGAGGDRIRSYVQDGSVDALATLVRAHGIWRLDSLRQAPWQQAT